MEPNLVFKIINTAVGTNIRTKPPRAADASRQLLTPVGERESFILLKSIRFQKYVVIPYQLIGLTLVLHRRLQ